MKPSRLTQIARLVFILLAFDFRVQADQLGDEIVALKIKLPPDRQLSSNKLRQVLELAHLSGIKRAETVGSALSQTGKQGLYVASPQFIEGRRMYSYSAVVWRADWQLTNAYRREIVNAETRGPFFIEQPSSQKHEWAIFTFKGKPVWMQCPGDSELAGADSALAAIAARRIRYASKQTKTDASILDFDAPVFVSVRAGSVYVSFKHADSSCDYFIRGRLEGDKLFVEAAGRGPCA